MAAEKAGDPLSFRRAACLGFAGIAKKMSLGKFGHDAGIDQTNGRDELRAGRAR
jgi:hypothetical protein